MGDSSPIVHKNRTTLVLRGNCDHRHSPPRLNKSLLKVLLACICWSLYRLESRKCHVDARNCDELYFRRLISKVIREPFVFNFVIFQFCNSNVSTVVHPSCGQRMLRTLRRLFDMYFLFIKNIFISNIMLYRSL